MKPHELKAARRFLALSVRGLASALEPPATPRTVRRWEAGTLDIPKSAVILIKNMLREKTNERAGPKRRTA